MGKKTITPAEIVRARLEKGETAKSIGEDCGVAPPIVAKIADGSERLNVRTLRRFVEGAGYRLVITAEAV